MNIMSHTECGTILYVVLWRWWMNTLTCMNKLHIYRLFVLSTRSVCWFSVDPQCYWFLELDGYKEYGVWLIINQEMNPLYIHIMITSKVNQWKNSICMTIVQMWQTAWCVLALCQKMNVDRCYKYLFYSKYNTGF